MNINGSRILNVSIQTLWDMLMDPDVLAKITPGVDRLELIDEDKYKAISEIKIGPVKGKFTGDIHVKDKVMPESFLLNLKQKSKIGNANVDIQFQLNDIETTQTELVFGGKAKLSGTVARTGQRVLTGVANKLINGVFKALEEQIEIRKATTI